MIINELLQWAAIAFMAVFLLGLTRQLGKYLVPARELAAAEVGPDIGSRLKGKLLPSEYATELRRLMGERGVDWAAVIVVSETCTLCKGLLNALTRDGAPEGAPVLALTSGESRDHQAFLAEAADMVHAAPDALEQAQLTTTPFAMLLDAELRIVHKDFAWTLNEVVENWRQGEHEAAAPAAGTPAPAIAQAGA
jgi:hypothetical protein